MTFRDTDRGYKALRQRLSERAQQVTVGIHEDVGSQVHKDSDATIAEIASFHEFGTSRTPERSFIRAWADEKKAEHEQSLRQIAGAVASGQVASVEQGLERFGVRCVGEVQRRIRDGIPPPLAESTVEAKGSSTPLIDSGELWTSVKHKVEPEKE